MKIYRFFLDLAEEITTGMANEIVVNSNFTLNVFQEHFPLISEVKGRKGWLGSHVPKILYPAINPKVFEKSSDYEKTVKDLISDQIKFDEKQKIFTSLNRYERKKNINLALKAFSLCTDKNSVLIVAGGWDPRVTENVEHEQELRNLASKLKISDRVAFLKSISNDDRLLLLE